MPTPSRWGWSVALVEERMLAAEGRRGREVPHRRFPGHGQAGGNCAIRVGSNGFAGHSCLRHLAAQGSIDVADCPHAEGWSVRCDMHNSTVPRGGIEIGLLNVRQRTEQ